MLPQRLRAEVKGYMVRDVIVPANSTSEVRAPFFPDWWQVRVQLGNSLSGILKVYPSRNNPSSAHRITGTGETQFPGRDAEQIILLENTSGFAMPLSVTASLGYPPSSVVNPVGIRNYAVQDITIGAGATVPVSVSFFPDWWEVRVHPNQPTDGVLLISPSTAPGVAPLQIIGTGEAQFPGQPNQSSISIQNTGSLPANVSVVASLGYPPTGVVNPITPAILLSASYVAVQFTRNAAPSASPVTFSYNHAGRYALVLLSMDKAASNAGGQISATSVSLGGVAGVRKFGPYQLLSNVVVSSEAWWIDAPNLSGVQTISIPYAGAPDRLYAAIFSFTDGVMPGNGSGGTVNNAALAMNIAAQKAGSFTAAIATVIAPTTHVETAGADMLDGVAGIGVSCLASCYKRNGAGTKTFGWSLTGTVNSTLGAFVGMEVTTQ